MQINIKKLIKSFGYAAKGIGALVSSEQNARVHLLATVAVIIAGVATGLNRYEWMGICAATGMVWAAEAFNTAVEKLVDLVSPERQPRAGLIKDLAAAGVLICAIIAVIVAGLIFVPHFI
jgi:diacylglycerol kinase (ATP)